MGELEKMRGDETNGNLEVQFYALKGVIQELAENSKEDYEKYESCLAELKSVKEKWGDIALIAISYLTLEWAAKNRKGVT